jgi:histone H1/5
LVQDAIIALKDRTGSSTVAIQKWIVGNHPDIDVEKLKKRLPLTFKSGIKSQKLIKIKSSFKLHPELLRKRRNQRKAKARKKAAVAKAKAEQQKKKELSKADLEALKEKEQREKAEKERQDRVRKRKFPMDDLKLIEEDKELKVVVKLPARPSLELAIPHFPAACRSDTMKSGLLDDIFHIYHFFRGDVGWGRFPKQKAVVAPFTLEQWMQCVQHVLKGWSRKARMLPPLMTHLFVVALQHLVPEQLKVALTPASWSEVLLYYMDAMERYYTDEYSEGKFEIPSLGIDTDYLFYASDDLKESSKLDAPGRPSPYLVEGTLKKAQSKLQVQDPWTLSAEELLSLLSALVDDVLASAEDCSAELDFRIDETYELLKAKRTADANYRKLYAARNKELAEEKKDRKSNGEAELSTRSNVKMTKISEAKLEKARKEQQKATDAYEKRCRGKRIRTEPIGLDRNFNEVYHSWNDPERAFVLQRGKANPSGLSFQVPDSTTYRMTWHSINKRSTLDKYMESLDVRGRREQGLYEALEPVRKFVHDDVKELNEKKALLKEKNNLKIKLEAAKTSYETGRKSGRLAAQSEQELIDLQNEIERLEETVAKGNVVQEYDFETETGLHMLREFDTQEEQNQKRASRRDTQKRQKEEEEASVTKLPCSDLWPTGDDDGPGMVGLIVRELLSLEKRTEDLVSWEYDDRKSWIANLEKAVQSWNSLCIPNLAPEPSNTSSAGSPDAVSKSATQGTPGVESKTSSTTIPQILSMIKVCIDIDVDFVCVTICYYPVVLILFSLCTPSCRLISATFT